MKITDEMVEKAWLELPNSSASRGDVRIALTAALGTATGTVEEGPDLRALAGTTVDRARWNSNMDEAPKDGTKVDLWGTNHLHPTKPGCRIVNVGWGPVRDWMGNERNDWQHGRGEDFEPTHWMHLPAAPSPETEG